MTTLLSPTQRLVRATPGVFCPSLVRGLTDTDGGLSTFNTTDGSLVMDSAIGETGSFRYDPMGAGIKSTQQLNIDYSSFENHVFFNSAEVKVNAAVNKLFDRFPFDGTRKETELFFDGMTGFESYVYSGLPKHKGYLFFSGSNTGDTPTRGTWITIKDQAGTSFPYLTENPTGGSRLDPTTGSVTFSFQIYPSTGSLQNQVVFQKQNIVVGTEQHGFGCFLSQSSNTTASVDLTFYVTSGSVNTLSTSVSVVKGVWTPVAFAWDRTSGTNQLFSYVSGALAASSSKAALGSLNFATASFFLGTGSNITTPLFVPQTTLSGGLDEVRYYTRLLTMAELVQYQSRSVFHDQNMKLYLKLNEPSGSTSNLVLDSSGQGMHGTLNSYALSTLKVRDIATGSYLGASPMIHEDEYYCPVLFPDQPEVVAYRESLLSDAAQYDMDNPTLITKLVPKHFFTYGQQQAALAVIDGSLTDLLSGSMPYSSSLGSTQTILSLLYMWAGFFDEIKLFIDAFATLRHVDYNNYDTVPDAFLKQLADFYGLDLPPLFAGSSIGQFINGQDLSPDIINSEYSLQFLQNQVWRRILINANDILKSKGTIHSIKAFLRAVGIEGDNIFRFKEYGGPVQRTFDSLRETRNEVGTVLNFRDGGYIKSPPLSASRIEPGYPVPQGTFIVDNLGHNTRTNNANDGLFTSGSWTYEGIYSFSGLPTTSSVQSLVRIMASSSVTTTDVLANLYATSGSGVSLYVHPNKAVGFSALTMSVTTTDVLANLYATSGSGVSLYVHPNKAVGFSALTMSVTTPDVMDGQVWNISFGRRRSDADSSVSSSYFLRVGRNNLGTLIEEYTTGSLYDDNCVANGVNNRFQTLSGSAPYIAVGSGSTNISLTGYANEHQLQTFDGKVSQMRFWSKDLAVDEWREHVRDYKSRGVADPRLNFGFETMRTGSFERLRADLSTDQINLSSDTSGLLDIFDFSQNNLHASGTGFPASTQVILPQRFYYSFISPNFDEACTNQKVRIRSFQSSSNVLNDEAMYSLDAPIYEIQQEQVPEDNAKFSIDFSIVDSLNQDMIEMFSSLKLFDTILGAPSMMFSGDYPDLEILQNLYFNRLTTKLNLRGFFDFFQWFNTNMGGFIAQLIPRKTNYKGISYVIASHLLERGKVEYHWSDMYIGENNRNRQKETLLLQLYSGILRKF